MIGMRAWESPIAWDDPTGRPMAEIDEAGSDLDGFLTGNRRVRTKSLYLGDSSDMNISLKQVRQSIVHVFDEWAEAPPNTIRMSAFVHSNSLSKRDCPMSGTVGRRRSC